MVLIDASFLATLPQNEMRSGLAEIYKHGLIADPFYWNKLTDLATLTSNDLNQIIHESVVIKNTIVLSDPREQNIRKGLNFGHTLGHAIESYCLGHETRTTLLHGEAIAIGMILECFISSKQSGLSTTALKEITTTLLEMYDYVAFDHTEIEPIIEFLKHDKKNDNGKINFVLLEAIGKPIIDQQVSNELIIEAFSYYTESQQ